MERFAQFSSRDVFRVAAGWRPEKREDRWPARYNISPGDQVLVMHEFQGYDRREIAIARWGYRPGWAERRSLPAEPTFAGPKAPESKYFKLLWEHRRRCVVPMDGWYEWLEVDGRRRAYFIQRKGGRPCYAAALTNVDPADPWRASGVTILTHPIEHGVVDRAVPRPVLLSREAMSQWICQSTVPYDCGPMLAHPTAPDLEAIALAASMSNPKAEGPDLLEPLLLARA
ncbi:SOS response-associated peptidase [Chitinolyticbacter albus]|uniref:SOS response-associated peptidase n=1 Tax=Chitinolyticbacter albus TaxID=2961951 RepID=UPI002108E26D|nr:SOS response-associated peptidase family protein [Chitinolyticbacter albus]